MLALASFPLAKSGDGEGWPEPDDPSQPHPLRKPRGVCLVEQGASLTHGVATSVVTDTTTRHIMREPLTNWYPASHSSDFFLHFTSVAITTVEK